MKKNLLNLLATTLALYVFTNAAFAQSNMHLRATVPFQFVADGTVLPSGAYDINGLQNSVIVIQNRSSHASAYAHTDADRPAKGSAGQTSLVFHKYGDSYFLTQITLTGNGDAMQLPVSREEQKLANARPKPQLVVVSLSKEPAISPSK